MDMRHIVAYGLILAMVIGPVAIIWLLRRATLRARREAQRPTHVTKEK